MINSPKSLLLTLLRTAIKKKRDFAISIVFVVAVDIIYALSCIETKIT